MLSKSAFDTVKDRFIFLRKLKEKNSLTKMANNLEMFNTFKKSPSGKAS